MSKDRKKLDTIIGLAALGSSITGVASLIAAIFPFFNGEFIAGCVPDSSSIVVRTPRECHVSRITGADRTMWVAVCRRVEAFGSLYWRLWMSVLRPTIIPE